MSKVSVIGLGQMGAALARLLVAAGYEVTVWHASLRLDAVPGARVVGPLDCALESSDLILICLRDISVARLVLQTPEACAALAGRTVVNLSGGSPADAQHMASWMQDQAADFIDGAVMNTAARTGLPGSRIVLAGDMDVQARVAPVLACLAAEIRYIGPNLRAAKASYQAFRMHYFGHLAAVLHAADICLSEGIDLSHLHALHDTHPVHQSFIQSLIDGHFRTDTVTLDHWAADLAMIRKQAAEAGIRSPFPDLLAGYFDRAIEAGHGQDDVMAIWKTLS